MHATRPTARCKFITTQWYKIKSATTSHAGGRKLHYSKDLDPANRRVLICNHIVLNLFAFHLLSDWHLDRLTSNLLLQLLCLRLQMSAFPNSASIPTNLSEAKLKTVSHAHSTHLTLRTYWIRVHFQTCGKGNFCPDSGIAARCAYYRILNMYSTFLSLQLWKK